MSVTSEQHERAPESTSRPKLSGLKKISFSENWPIRSLKNKQFLLMRVGDHLEDIVDTVLKDPSLKSSQNLRVGQAREIPYREGQQFVLRLVHVDRGIHRSKVDVVLKSQGQDLFVRFQLGGYTALRYLKAFVYAGAFLFLWSLAFTAFYLSADVRGALVLDIAQKYPGDRAVTAEFLEYGHGDTPGASIWELYQRDPSLFLWKMGIPAGVIASICAGVLSLAPPEMIRIPCRLLGWPTPEEFEGFLFANAAWAEGLLSSVLFHEFGLDETQKLTIGPSS